VDKETLKGIIKKFIENKIPLIKKRNLNIPLDSEKIITITGVRRSGKTCLFYQTISDLLKSGIQKEQILYISFRDNKLFPMNIKSIEMVLKTFYEMYPENIEKKIYLFFDDINLVPNWENNIKTIYEQYNASIFLSSSIASMFLKMTSNRFKARTENYKLFPLSFGEYIQFLGIKNKEKSIKTEVTIYNAFNEYLLTGGLPEVALTNKENRLVLLKEYISKIIFNDLLENYEINNVYILKYLLKYCCMNIGSKISINRIFNNLKDTGVTLSKNTLYEYFEYLQQVYHFVLMPKYEESSVKQQKSSKKLFSVDNGLIMPYLEEGLTEKRKLSNVIFMNFYRKNYRLSYYKNRHDIDFVIQNNLDRIKLINIVCDLEKIDYKEPEYKSLINGKNYFQNSDLFLIFKDGNENKLPDEINALSCQQHLLNEIYN